MTRRRLEKEKEKRRYCNWIELTPNKKKEKRNCTHIDKNNNEMTRVQ